MTPEVSSVVFSSTSVTVGGVATGVGGGVGTGGVTGAVGFAGVGLGLGWLGVGVTGAGFGLIIVNDAEFRVAGALLIVLSPEKLKGAVPAPIAWNVIENTFVRPLGPGLVLPLNPTVPLPATMAGVPYVLPDGDVATTRSKLGGNITVPATCPVPDADSTYARTLTVNVALMFIDCELGLNSNVLPSASVLLAGTLASIVTAATNRYNNADSFFFIKMCM